MRNSELTFRIVANHNCPYYAAGDEFKLSGNALLLELRQEKTFVSTAIITPPYEKETCRTLIGDLTRVLIANENVDRIPKESLNCSGCSGNVTVEPCHSLRGDPTATKDRNRNIDVLAGILNNFSIFQALDRQNLRDIVGILKLKKYGRDEIILKKGEPARNLHVILSGSVDVLDEKGVRLSTLQKGDVFGEMSLISGEPVGATIRVLEPAAIIFIKGQDFKEIINKFPSIQLYLARLLAQRLAKSNLAIAEDVGSGMMGCLSELTPAELFQTMNLNQKTGRLSLQLPSGTAHVAFRKGEAVAAKCNGKRGKEAFFELLREHEGRFKFHPDLSEKERDAASIGSFMDLLLEGLRRLDEAAEAHELPGQILV